MKETLKKILLVTLVSLTVCFMWVYAIGADVQIVKYISGQYGTNCYVEGNEHGNIKYRMEFNSLEACLEYVEQN